VLIAGIQCDTIWEDPASNFAKLSPYLDQGAEQGARLILLPEMFACGFSMATERTAESPDGPTATFLSEQAARLGVWLGGTAPISDGTDLPANRFLLMAPDGSLAAHYDKIHPFTYSGEHEHFAAGDRHVTVDIEGIRTALFICYDLRFADEFWPLAPDTDLYLIPANWPAKRGHHWRSLLMGRAIENQAYIAGINRVGTAGRLDYRGDSAIIDPMGEILDSASGVESVILAEVSPAVVSETRARFPFLEDRR
jgi:predicted amidohydrolase